MTLSEKFNDYANSLQNQWSFERFGNCLHLLAISENEDSKLASTLFDKLTSQTDMSIGIKNTLIGTQGFNLITKYQNIIHT